MNGCRGCPYRMWSEWNVYCTATGELVPLLCVRDCPREARP